MKFKVGDMAILVESLSIEPAAARYIGQIVEIVDPLGSHICLHGPQYGIRFENGNEAWATEGSLKPIPPKQETTTWDQCVWQPKGVEA